jgi:iron(III) transport system substrate-binding protein
MIIVLKIRGVRLAMIFFVILGLCSFTAIPEALGSSEVRVYSSRKEYLIKPLLNKFEKESKIKVKLLTGAEGPLIEKLKLQGKNPEADLLITVDAGNLWFAATQGILTPFDSKQLKNSVPTHLRDPQDLWFGLSIRARTIVYHTGRIKPAQLSTYENLGLEGFKGRLCLRTSKKVYNQSLVAMMIADLGEAKTEAVIKKWVANLAAPPFANDTQVIKGILAGRCDVGIVNTYYFGRLEKEKGPLKAALFWPNQKQSGVHVNISGAGIVRHAKNLTNAQRLLEWLAEPAAQKEFAELNLEYPVNAKVSAAPAVEKWGDFKQNLINVSKAGELQTKAMRLMERAQYH